MSKKHSRDSQFTCLLLDWQRRYGRHDLPWQRTNEWYPRLVSELMLQQTQVSTVIPKYEAFLTAWPDAASLSSANDDDVMALWAGLGYYARARNLLKSVRRIVNDFGGVCPPDAAAFSKLPGVGPSTAGAMAAFVHGERAVMADGNAQRVLARVFLIPGSPDMKSFQRAVWHRAETLLPSEADMADYTQGLMDFGSMVCTKKPVCRNCPMASICSALKTGKVAEYPGRKPKKERPIRYGAAVFLFSGDAVYLRKKTEEGGVWRGLWLPFVRESNDPPANSTLLAASGVGEAEVSRYVALPEVVHDFTHYRLILRAAMADLVPGEQVPDGYCLFSADQDGTVGLPTPIAKLLTYARSLRQAMPTALF